MSPNPHDSDLSSNVSEALRGCSLQTAEDRYRQGRATREEVAAFLRAWNAGPVLTQAVLVDERIRNFDPVERRGMYGHLYEEFGVRM